MLRSTPKKRFGFCCRPVKYRTYSVKIPRITRQPLTSSHIKLHYYTIKLSILQELYSLFLIFKRTIYIEFFSYFCLFFMHFLHIDIVTFLLKLFKNLYNICQLWYNSHSINLHRSLIARLSCICAVCIVHSFLKYNMTYIFPLSAGAETTGAYVKRKPLSYQGYGTEL